MKHLFATLLLLLTIGATVRAQAPDSAQVRNTIWASPAEVLYKQQVGYERCLSSAYSLGIQAANHTGYNGEYQGWNVTVLGRHYFKKRAPFGLYHQVQAAVYQYEQQVTIYPVNGSRDGYKGTDYRWRGMGAGIGTGLGYRLPVLKKAFRSHLSLDAMLGVRYYSWPKPQYNAAQYEERSFLGGDADWFLAGPGSIVHGLLTVGYSF